jgi:hypothetical protein
MARGLSCRKGAAMPPSAEPAADLAVNELPAGDIAVPDSAAPIFGIALGMVVMIVLALNALAY